MMLRVAQSLLKQAIVRQQQQAFRVAVQPPGSVYARNINEILERGVACTLVGELRKHAIRLIEDDAGHVIIIPDEH